MSVSHDHLTDEEKIRILSRGLKAALRWPYDTSMLKHIADPSTAMNHNFDDRYLDYEPEPIILCHVCGDEPVERKGRACDYCVSSDDDEMRDMAARANAFLPTPKEARTMARLSEVAHG